MIISFRNPPIFFESCLKLIYFDLTFIENNLYESIETNVKNKKIASKHHNKNKHSLKFSNAFCGFHRRSAKKINYFQKFAILDLSGIFFTKAEP